MSHRCSFNYLLGATFIIFRRVNCVDVTYAALPMYLYLNSSLLGYLLRPLLEYQESSLYPNPYAAIDIGKWTLGHLVRVADRRLAGSNYSMATGNNEEHDQGIERGWSAILMLDHITKCIIQNLETC